MASFSAQIINNTTPAITVIEEGGTISYNQIKQSLGTYVYKVNKLYLYSDNISQLIGAINYNSYDSDGNRNITNIVTTVNPYQLVTSIFVDLAGYPTNVIFNGNSSVSTNILGNTQVQVKFFSKRVTNSFGGNLTNFLVGERMAGKPNFFDNYGDIKSIEKSNIEAEKSATLYKNATGDGSEIKSETKSNMPKDISSHLLLVSFASISIGIFLYLNKKRNV
jgi:hypothetical protein